MRIYPPVSKAEALAWLTAQANTAWGDNPPVTAEVIDTVAEALSMISAIEVPDETEPLFP